MNRLGRLNGTYYRYLDISLLVPNHSYFYEIMTVIIEKNNENYNGRSKIICTYHFSCNCLLFFRGLIFFLDWYNSLALIKQLGNSFYGCLSTKIIGVCCLNSPFSIQDFSVITISHERVAAVFWGNAWESVKSDFRSENFKRKFRLTNLMIGRSKTNIKNCFKRAFEQRNKGTQINIWPWVSASRSSYILTQVYKYPLSKYCYQLTRIF